MIFLGDTLFLLFWKALFCQAFAQHMSIQIQILRTDVWKTSELNLKNRNLGYKLKDKKRNGISAFV
ncbi:hypothetical protein DXA13_13510 [Clostridium sp. AM58-1XD]|nr:hypothetical protein DXA13_13510 [Clostridium sp. AM58-1XD]